MAPVHHHFELAWSETDPARIVASAIAAIGSTIYRARLTWPDGGAARPWVSRGRAVGREGPAQSGPGYDMK